MPAFQPYAGSFRHQDEILHWSCYATRPVYEVRALDANVPEAPKGRKWVSARQHGRTGPHLAILVDDDTTEFSQMLAQVSEPEPGWSWAGAMSEPAAAAG